MSLVPLTRRRFLFTLTLAAPASSRVVRAMGALNASQLAFAGIVAAHDPEAHRIEVYRVNDGHWRLSSSIAATAPRAIVLHPTLPVLYVAHCIAEHQHRPRGSVSAFRIDTSGARLSRLSQAPLTLAATLPDRIAIAPDGRHLVIASTASAIFNLFPLGSDGALIPTPSPIKLPGLASSRLSVAFRASSSAVLVTTSNCVECLEIRSGSSLVRGLPIKASEDSEVQCSSATTLKRELAAQYAASFALLDL